MNRLASWIRAVVVGYKRNLTDEQINGDACALCGARFTKPEYRTSFGWIGLPLLRRAYACQYACNLDTVDDVEALFRSAIPARQNVWNWHLGVDDVPLVNDYDGFDVVDTAYVAAIDAQPKVVVEIVHRNGILTTRPLPKEYAGQIAVQAQKLGFTAMVSEGQATATDQTPPRYCLAHGTDLWSDDETCEYCEAER